MLLVVSRQIDDDPSLSLSLSLLQRCFGSVHMMQPRTLFRRMLATKRSVFRATGFDRCVYVCWFACLWNVDVLVVFEGRFRRRWREFWCENNCAISCARLALTHSLDDDNDDDDDASARVIRSR